MSRSFLGKVGNVILCEIGCNFVVLIIGFVIVILGLGNVYNS